MKIKYNLFSLLTIFLVSIIPFYVIIKVFFETKLGIKNFGFIIKEMVIVVLFLSLIYEFIKNKKIPKLEILDYLIFSYFGYGILITLLNGLGISSIVYGGRYDFIFFIVLLIYKHGKQFLKISIRNLIKIFIVSASISLFFGIFIKFIIGEQTLILFGFTSYISNWTFNGGIPNYHGLENSGIKRFQGILDGPNSMAYFLIIYAGLILSLNKKKLEYYIVLLLLFIFSLIILTYSRSAIIGVSFSLIVLFLLNIKKIYIKYRKYFLSIFVLITLFSASLLFIFQEKVYNIIFRPSSTEGHFDRMEIGINRFKTAPLGQGLATAGPAYRGIYKNKTTRQDEEYFIPESWFIQQLIEGGIIYFLLFISIFINILINLYKKSKSVFGILCAVLIMNIFLHIFESTYLSILLFIFIGLLLDKE